MLEYAARKQETVVRLIEAGDFTAYPDALRFIITVKDAGLRIAAASSSKNAGLFLRQIRLDSFAQDQGSSSTTIRWLSSTTSTRKCLGRDFAHGKPDPETFLTAAQELSDTPARGIRSQTRRLRSDLRTLRVALDPDWTHELRGELRWLGGELGAARDRRGTSACAAQRQS